MIKLPDEKCTGCEACTSLCPAKAIEMRTDGEGFLRPAIDREKCTECGLCLKRCPVTVESHGAPSIMPALYAAWHTDPATREASSSGGVFSALAEQILSQGGVVFGAAYADNMEVRHHAVTSSAELHSLRGSKYVQSRIGRTFLDARQHLESGRQVLFTGTPCQIAGLRAFLGKEHEGLFTCDLLCHGVPSPGLWDAYIRSLEGKRKRVVRSVQFRSKEVHWLKPSVVLDYRDGGRTVTACQDDMFMRCFLADLALRPACYRCNFKALSYPGDITLADFWVVRQVHPDLPLDAGISMLLINSEKGRSLVSAAGASLFLRDSSASLPLVKAKTNLLRSANLPPGRETFLATVGRASFEEIIAGKIRPRNQGVRLLANAQRRMLRLKKMLSAWTNRRPR